MATLPRSKRRLSSADAVGAVRPPSDPGLQVPNIGGAEARAVEEIGNQIRAEGDKRLKQQLAASARRQNRQDQIQGVKAARAFNQAGSAEFIKMNDTEDISLEEIQDKYHNFITQKKSEALAGYKGSAVGRHKLELKLEELGNAMLDDSSMAGEKEQRRVLGEQIDEDIRVQIDIAQADPTMIGESLANIEQILIDNENTLTPAQEDAFRGKGQEQVYTQALNTFIFKNGIDEAIGLLNTPQARKALGFKQVQAMRLRIKKFEDSNAEDPGLEDKVDSLRIALGRDPTEKEVLALAGIKNDPSKQSALDKALGMLKTAEESGIPISEEQRNQVIHNALGIGKSAEQKGIDEATQQIAKNKKLKAANELPPGASDLTDESGNVKNEVSNSVATRITEALGGSFDSVSGKSTGLNAEQAQFAIVLNAEAEALIRDGEVRGVNEAVSLVTAGRDLPQSKTFSSTATEMLQVIREPNEQDIKEGAAAFDKIDLDNATGPASALKNAWNRSIGLFSNDFVNSKNVEDRNRLKMLAHEFILANKRSDRLPVFEQKRLEAIFSGPGFFESGEATRAVFRSLDDQISEDLIIKQKMLAIDGIPGKEKQEIIMDLLTLSRFQKKLRSFDMTPGGSTTVEINNPKDVEGASDQDLRRFVNRDKEGFKALPPEIKKAIKAKLRGKNLPSGLEPLPKQHEREGKKKSPVKGEFGLRVDGTKKGVGFLGLLERPDGKVSTEISIGIELDGKEVLMPTLVPTLTKKEIKTLLSLPEGGVKDIPEEIIEKAVQHAGDRIREGKSPFFEEGE